MRHSQQKQMNCWSLLWFAALLLALGFMVGKAFSVTGGHRWHTRQVRSLHSRGRITRSRHIQCAEGTEGKAAAGDDDADGTSVELFRQSLIQGWGSDGMGSSTEDANWAKLVTDGELAPGMVLLANPAAFIGEDGDTNGPRRVGLRGLMPPDWPSREKLRLMPVVLITRIRADGVAEGVSLTLRTGRLMGDFFNHFHSRPLYLGGTEEAGLTMLHPYPPNQVPGAELLSESSGLYINTDAKTFDGAQAWVEEGQGSSLRFRFFIQHIRWLPGDLKDEVEKRIWVPVTCSTDLVLAEVDSVGEKPLWAQIAELAGGDVEDAGRLYGLIDN